MDIESKSFEIDLPTRRLTRTQRLIKTIKSVKIKHKVGIFPLILLSSVIVWLTILIPIAHIKEGIQDGFSSFGNTAGILISIFLYICLATASLNDIKKTINYIKTGNVDNQMMTNTIYYTLLL